MNFCILIELSKERISFLYNRSDSDNGFVPLVEQGSLPLAIYCSGNQIEIGQFAVNEANKQNSNAFTDVFEKMRDGGTFRYRGEEIPNNMLLFTAIQRYLSSFFDNTLIGQLGRLEQNIATMPICFVFNADLNENERLFVKDSFLKSGFANVGIRDYDQLAMQTLKTNRACYLCVTSNGEDLFVNIYNRNGKCLESMVIRHRGRDPRMEVAVEKLWDSIGYDNYYLNRKQEQCILEQVAEEFLGSGNYSLNESVTFSNGDSYDVALSLHELEQFSVKEDGKAIADIMRKLSENDIKATDCTVILQGKAAHNSFFFNMFKKEFSSVTNVDNALRTEILATFLDKVKASGYKFGEGISSSNATKPTKEPPFEPINTVRPEATQPTKRDERDFKMLRLEVETCLANGKTQQAKTDVERFTLQMHSKGIVAFDEELNNLLRKLSSSTPEMSVPKQSVSPTKRDERDMKMLRMEVATYIQNGEIDNIKKAVKEFREKMHAKDVYFFDEELKTLEAGKALKSTNNKPTSNIPKSNDKIDTKKSRGTSSAKKNDEGTSLMQLGKFKEARDWFRANDKPTNADDCTKIIRGLRFIPIYESELQSTIETKNKEKARTRVKDIKAIINLYKKYGLEASQLAKLLEGYNRIR